MSYPYHLFERIGVELEYMIVDGGRLNVLPVTDSVIRAACGEYRSDVERGPVTWSNELALHVIELKTTDPVASLERLSDGFQENVRTINALMEPIGGRLCPGAMHPWMDPHREMRLWPHEYSPVYEAFDRIFSCKGHGWANLQSTHINLPFGEDERPDGEFGRLHAAIRLVLPILPALAASSPVMDGRATGTLDNRLAVYKTNARRVPSVSGRVIPEGVYTRADYERIVLGRIYEDLAPLDPEGVLRFEWANARGCIARFERGSIEIRVLDVQECPRADVAIVAAVTAVVRALTEERWGSLASQQAWPVEPLAGLLDATIRDAERAIIADRAYLDALGFPAGRSSATAGEVWRHLMETCAARGPESGFLGPAEAILAHGTLATRLVRALGDEPDRRRMREVYEGMCDCLERAELFGV